MKKLFIMSVCLIGAFISKATIRTVCNIPSPSAQFSTIQAAVDSSKSGDTILVQGSGTPYASFVIADKRLVVIGPGWKPLRNVPQLVATVASCTINGTASSGTEIQGLTFTNGAIIQNTVSINNIRIVRNHITGILNIGNRYMPVTPVNYSNFLIEGNWFEYGSIYGSDGNSNSNFIIQNNLFYKSYMYDFFKTTNTLLDHNLFYSNSASIYYPFVFNGGSACYNFTIQNNIFSRADPIYVNTGGYKGVTNCVFKNNITFNTSATAPWTLNGNTDGGGNILNQDPQMASQTQVNSGVDDPLLNFTIAAGPANNKATDGKDMGLLYDAAGSLNWTYSRNSRLPYVYNIMITNPNITQGGSLNVTVEARKTN